MPNQTPFPPPVQNSGNPPLDPQQYQQWLQYQQYQQFLQMQQQQQQMAGAFPAGQAFGMAPPPENFTPPMYPTPTAPMPPQFNQPVASMQVQTITQNPTPPAQQTFTSEQLAALIRESKYFDEQEKNGWLAALPDLTNEQIQQIGRTWGEHMDKIQTIEKERSDQIGEIYTQFEKDIVVAEKKALQTIYQAAEEEDRKKEEEATAKMLTEI
jgi:hypothetical protein